MPRIRNEDRDLAMTAWRQHVFDYWDFVPFPHQAEWMLASDGLVLMDGEDPEGALVRLEDGSTQRRAVTPRPHGRAKVLADLGAFKAGKSKGGAMWAAGFACIPDARVSLVGLEYDICAPEFEYLCEALLSERGGNPPLMKYESLQNRPRDGRMWLDLENGARFEAKSWERKDTLKGKEIDCYLFCEAFMLPGLECYTGISQNLRARRGYSLFATTPDRPWVQVFHDCGHGNPDFPDWHCTCSVPASVNPFTFDAAAQKRDDPEHGGLMTREKFAIAYLGRLGDYVGRVYNYQRGTEVFSASTHPRLFPDGETTLAGLRIPEGWTVMGAADTGTFMSGLLVAFDPEGTAYVIYEQPNYRYVATEPELNEATSIPQWAADMRMAMFRFGVHGLWADKNSQFKQELVRNHDIALLPAAGNLQTRTEVTREYFQAGKILFAPWIKVLPFEVEQAQWPEEATAAGRFERMKKNDHTLDPLEHLLERRPFGRVAPADLPKGSWALSMGLRPHGHSGNAHLGKN
jgi:hypothetical protein